MSGEEFPGGPRPGIGAALAALVDDARRLVSLEIELAKQEVTGLLKRNGIAAGMLVGAAVGGLFFFIFLQVWLVAVLPHHAIVAAVIWGFWLAAAVLLALIGKSKLKLEAPTITLQTLKDDVEWVKQQIKQLPR